MAVTIDGRTLKGKQVLRVARPGPSGRYEKATLAKSAREAIAATRAYIDANFMRDEAPLMYSFNTGVGLFKDQRVLMSEMAEYQMQERLRSRHRDRRAVR
jgi:histidine ammonia-lyase